MDATPIFYRGSMSDKGPFVVVAEIRLGERLYGQTLSAMPLMLQDNLSAGSHSVVINMLRRDTVLLSACRAEYTLMPLTS